MIYDVNPDKFMLNISKFVDQVDKVDYLNLFINSLVNEESGTELEFMRPKDKEQEIKNAHSQFMEEDIFAKGETSSTKVNSICDALKQELVKRNESNEYLLPILTTYVKKQPQELKEVLSLIRTMQQDEKSQNLETKVVPPHLNP